MSECSSCDCNCECSPMRTKFICTIGPASSNKEVMKGLALSGATMFRNNFAHAQYDEYLERKAIVDSINKEFGTSVQMQADIQGPNIRVGEMPNGGVQIEPMKEYTFYTNATEDIHEEGDLFINDETLHLDVKEGEPITFMDGALEGEILKVNGNRITVQMINGGLLKSRKSVNVPETKLSSSAITEKDKRDIEFLLEAGVDWLALSFISTAAEIAEVRKMIGDKPVKIISKVERREAIKNIHEIIEASDAVMIARGDLGIELPMEVLPILQKQMVNMCEYAGKPVIIATQMLLSMVRSHRPTRAEVSDVANAIIDRADAVMLSEETAEGIDPVNALQTMRRICQEVEDYLYNRPNGFDLI